MQATIWVARGEDAPVSTEPNTLTCAVGHMWQTWVVTRAMASCLAATSSAVGDRARQKLTISAHHRLSFVRKWEEQRSGAAGLALAVRRTGKHCRYWYGCFTLVGGEQKTPTCHAFPALLTRLGKY